MERVLESHTLCASTLGPFSKVRIGCLKRTVDTVCRVRRPTPTPNTTKRGKPSRGTCVTQCAIWTLRWESLVETRGTFLRSRSRDVTTRSLDDVRVLWRCATHQPNGFLRVYPCRETALFKTARIARLSERGGATLCRKRTSSVDCVSRSRRCWTGDATARSTGAETSFCGENSAQAPGLGRVVSPPTQESTLERRGLFARLPPERERERETERARERGRARCFARGLASFPHKESLLEGGPLLSEASLDEGGTGGEVLAAPADASVASVLELYDASREVREG